MIIIQKHATNAESKSKNQAMRLFDKKKIPLIIISILVILSMIALWLTFILTFDKPKHIRKANEKQADYLFNQLKTAKKAKITKDSYNKDIIEHKIYEISDLSEINSLIESLRFEYVSDYCLCLGSINLEFFLESGETVKINYARGHYIKFNGPGFIQGIPTKEFERRITKILNTKPSKIETGKHLEIFPTLNKEDSFELLRAGGYLEGNKSYISPEKKEYEKKMDK